jgi:hypothetical protein
METDARGEASLQTRGVRLLLDNVRRILAIEEGLKRLFEVIFWVDSARDHYNHLVNYVR